MKNKKKGQVKKKNIKFQKNQVYEFSSSMKDVSKLKFWVYFNGLSHILKF